MAMENLVLPFRGDQFSFTLNYKGEGDDDYKIDMSAIILNRQGKIMDCVSTHKPSALDGAVVSNKDKSYWPAETQVVEGDEVITVMPKHLDPAAEVMVIIASAPQLPGKANDLNHSAKLDFTVLYQDDDDRPQGSMKNSKVTDLKPLVSGPSSKAPPTGLGNGHQSMIICTVFLDQPGWTVRNDLSTFTEDSYGHIIPDIKKAVLKLKNDAGVDLDAARGIVEAGTDESEMATCTRVLEDHTLSETAAVRIPEPTEVSKLRIDLGWSTWKPPKGEEEEEEEDAEPEGTEVDFTLIFYDLKGEEVQQVSSGNTEAEGVKVGREFEEPEAEEEPEPEEEEAEGEEAGEGEEGGEAKEEVPPPPPPLQPKEDPYAFALKQVVFIDIKALPKEVRTAVLIVNNYAGNGFQHVRHVRARMYNISNGEDSENQKEATTPPRELVDYGLISKFGMDKAVTQVALLKLYKEYNDSAYQVWKASTTQTPAEFIAGDNKVVKESLKAFLASYKLFKEKEAKLLAAAEEEGEEVSYEIRESTWRYSVPGLMMPGESLEEAEHDMKNIINYDGPLQSLTPRVYDSARAMFPPPAEAEDAVAGDTYFGGYADDKKSGYGIYLFATGAAYIGQYADGKRSGHGVMILPDGGLYEGQVAADRFHGQGQYSYPDGSVYTGSWAEGKKDGYGVYWDTSKGCLRGNWSKGILKGEATYDQPALHMEAEFVQGVPAGVCHYTAVSHRTLDMDKFAASHIVEVGPTLKMQAQYGIPPGSGADPKLDEEGLPIEDDEKPPLPNFPKYEGLTFESKTLPNTVDDVAFPPVSGLVKGIEVVPEGTVPIPAVPTFTVATGLIPAEQAVETVQAN